MRSINKRVIQKKDLSSDPTIQQSNLAGGNVQFRGDWLNNKLYVDIVKGSRGFSKYINNIAQVCTGSDGWPTIACQLVLSVEDKDINNISHSGNAAPGTYKMSYTIDFNSTSRVTLPSNQGSIINEILSENGLIITADLIITTNTTILDITGSLKNLKIIRPGYPSNTTEMFDYHILRYLKQFTSIRFMEFQAMNRGTPYNQPSGLWSQRITSDNTHGGYYDVGGPIEECIALANELRIQPASSLSSIWVNCIHTADNDYITNFCTLLRDTVNPNLIIYIELGNECWNYSFPASSWFLAIGGSKDPSLGDVNLDYDHSTDANQLRFRAYARRVRDLAMIAKTIFGPSAMNKRVRIVLGAQAGGTGYSRDMLMYLQRAYFSEPVGNYIYGLATATYYGLPNASANGLTPTQIIQAMINDPLGITEVIRINKANKDVCVVYGVKLLNYEGGVGLDTMTSNDNKINARLTFFLDPDMVNYVILAQQNLYMSGTEFFEFFRVDPGTHFPSNNSNSWWAITEDMDLIQPKLKGYLSFLKGQPPKPSDIIANNKITATGTGTVLAKNWTDASPGTFAGLLAWYKPYLPNYTMMTNHLFTDGNLWIDFSIFVEATGSYNLIPYIASADCDQTYSFEIDGIEIGSCLVAHVHGTAITERIIPALPALPVSLIVGWHKFRVISHTPATTTQTGINKIEFIKI
jgi:hypothetical protein